MLTQQHPAELIRIFARRVRQFIEKAFDDDGVEGMSD
jgi:hypothetical protein